MHPSFTPITVSILHPSSLLLLPGCCIQKHEVGGGGVGPAELSGEDGALIMMEKGGASSAILCRKGDGSKAVLEQRRNSEYKKVQHSSQWLRWSYKGSGINWSQKQHICKEIIAAANNVGADRRSPADVLTFNRNIYPVA